PGCVAAAARRPLRVRNGFDLEAKREPGAAATEDTVLFEQAHHLRGATPGVRLAVDPHVVVPAGGEEVVAHARREPSLSDGGRKSRPSDARAGAFHSGPR